MVATAWKKHAWSIVFCIVFIGSLFAFSTAKEEAMGLGTVIGIDLGTTYSRVGVYNYKNGDIEVILNDQCNRTAPSWVGFTDNEILIGEAAKNQGAVNLERTIFDVKWLIGKNFEDKEVQKDMKLVPYKIVNKDGKPYIQVKVKDGETKVFSPEEISAMILTKLKETAEAYIGMKIKDAVIAVPAYFNEAQRQAIKDAGIIAGLNVRKIINEPTAAAIAFGLKKQPGNKNILVFDLGGGTFDVSILTVFDSMFEVVATNGDTHLGGDDFDQRVMEYFIKLIQKKHDIDITKDNRALGKLRSTCERAKRALSSQNQVLVEIKSLINGIDFSEPLTRVHFEEMNNDLFKKTMNPVKKAMEDAGFEKNQIDEIVLVGRSARIPKVQELLKEYFNGKELRKGVNPDEAVAYGAAIEGALGGDEDEFKWASDWPGLLPSWSPHALGIETVGGVMTVLIPSNQFIPTKRSQVFTTYQDQQTTVTIKVYEMGVSTLTKDCRLIGTFNLSGIPPAPRGSPEIEVTFEVDANDMENLTLNVKAKEKGSGKYEKMRIQKDKNTCKKEVREARVSIFSSMEEYEEALKRIDEEFEEAMKRMVVNEDEFPWGGIEKVSKPIDDRYTLEKYTEKDKTLVNKWTSI